MVVAAAPADSRDGMHGAGPVFKRIREAGRLSVEEVAHRSEIPVDTLRKIENNRRNASRAYAERICEVVGSTVDRVMDEVVGVPELLPAIKRLRLVTYVVVRNGVETPYEVSPSRSLPPHDDELELVGRCLGPLQADEVLQAREAMRSEKELWVEAGRGRVAEAWDSELGEDEELDLRGFAFYFDPPSPPEWPTGGSEVQA